MDRRKFLKVSGAASVTAVWGGSLACAASAASSTAGSTAGGTAAASASTFPLNDVGLQLYTVRTLAEKNLEQTLQQVAAAGYRLVETHTNYGKSPTELRALLDKNGLRSPSGHYGLAEITEAPDKTIATAKALGQEYVVLNWLDPEHRSAEFYRGFPALLNKFGAQAKAAGLGFAHHNHDFEFDKMGGPTPVIETVIANTDPALVSFEVDLYWVYKAGSDPQAFVEQHRGRVSMVHIKDSTAAPQKAMADVGKGVIDFGKVLAAAKKANVRYAYVERDDTTDPIATIRVSHDHLATLLASR
jgi:sugar phosphate isomerase/epimerase